MGRNHTATRDEDHSDERQKVGVISKDYNSPDDGKQDLNVTHSHGPGGLLPMQTACKENLCSVGGDPNPNQYQPLRGRWDRIVDGDEWDS